jgi:glutathione S-transferase
MAAFGHGYREEITSAAAIDIAKASTAAAIDMPTAGPDESGLNAGEDATVWSVDHPDSPVTGRLVALSHDRVSIARKDPRAGSLQVHFPRIGYRVERRAGAM